VTSPAAEVTLPGGLARDGAWRRTVWLRPWTGRDELFLHEEARGLPPAARATALLARCVWLNGGGEAAGPAFARALTAGDREALLLHLRRITLGDALACVLSCPRCGEKLDLELSVSGLLLPPYPDAAAEYAARVGRGRGACDVRFRLPNGGDLEHAAARAATDPGGAAREVLARCVRSVHDARGRPVDGLPPVVEAELPGRMAALDPQAELLLDAACPRCGAAFQALLDAGEYVLQEAARACAQLFRQVHLLAFHYHWSEEAILAMAGSRRRRYLGLLADALGAGRAA
jgi:hypothetical protein